MKYKYSEIINKISKLVNTNEETHKNYLISLIDRTIIDPFPEWFEVTKFGNYAFGYCNNITSAIIPEGVTTIGNSSFLSCINLTNVTIPDGVTTIQNGAFRGTKIASIIIPSSVTSLGSQVFMYCHSLTDMYLYPTTPPSLAETNAISTATTTIHVPIGSGDAYKTATNWSQYADKIVEDIEI